MVIWIKQTKRLHQAPTRRDVAHHLHPFTAGDRYCRASTIRAKAIGRDAARGVDQHGQQVRVRCWRCAHHFAVPMIIGSRCAAIERYIATGLKTRFNADLLTRGYNNIGSAVACGVNGVINARGRRGAACNQRPKDINILGTFDGQVAVRGSREVFACGKDIDTTAFGVRPRTRARNCVTV